MRMGAWATVEAKYWVIDLVFDTCHFRKMGNMTIIKAGSAPNHGMTLRNLMITGQTTEITQGGSPIKINPMLSCMQNALRTRAFLKNTLHMRDG
jgi:hypothetical protein